MTEAAGVNARGRQQRAVQATARQPMPRRDGRKAPSFNMERMEDEAMVYAVDASGTNGSLAARATRASKRPVPKKGGPDWQQAREEYGVFEHQRNPGRPAMYSSRIQQQSGAVETDLRAERVTQDWDAAVQRRDAERRTRARTSTE